MRTSVVDGLRFRDRQDAGRRLAGALEHLRDERPLVVGLPRGGVEVAYEVARALDAPLDVVVVRKLSLPSLPEYAIGAVGEDDVVLTNGAALARLQVGPEVLDAIVAREQTELERRSQRFRGGIPPTPVADRTVLLVDDGIATGATALAAARVLRMRGARRIVLAVPVGPVDVAERFADAVDEVVCLERPSDFFAVGQAYDDFAQTSDEEVVEILRLARRGAGAEHVPAGGPRNGRASGGTDLGRVVREDVRIPIGGGALDGTIDVPPSPRGLVLFAHGSGSSRHSPRNVHVASALQVAGFATLLFDLLTEPEGRERARVFDVDLLASRLAAAQRVASGRPSVAGLPVGLFGASTGAAAALSAAAAPHAAVRAIVLRGGRPDLAQDRLATVRAPTLLIVGGEDRQVVELNRQAAARLRCSHRLAVVPGAGHLFAEPGALEQVIELSRDWFGEHLAAASPAPRSRRHAGG